MVTLRGICFNLYVMRKIITLVAGLMFVISACTHKKTEREATVQTVKTDTVRVYGEKNCSVFPGKVKAASDVNLAFRISGPVEKVYVDAGAFVKKGQLLAEMDSRDYVIQLSATEAEYNRIKAEAERIITLHEKGSVTPNDYDKAVYGLRQITAKYDAHKNALSDTRLCAPFDGYIQKRHFEAGETVGAGMPVISMISASLPEVEIHIPSSDFVRRDRFESFSCSIDIYPDVTFSLDLIGVAQKANLNQLYTVRLKMKERTQQMLSPNTTTTVKERSSQMPSPGMTTMVTVQYKPAETTSVYIPFSAIFEYNGVTSVWVYNKSTQTVEVRAVTLTEILNDGIVIISDGLHEGEIVVTAGVHVLRQGEKVKLLPAVSSTNIGGLL
jgi:RND family efflux transporter MFP subunit